MFSWARPESPCSQADSDQSVFVNTTMTHVYVADAKMLRTHPRLAAFGRRSSRRQAGTSATPLPPRPPSRRATYTAPTPGRSTCTCTWTLFRGGTAGKPLPNGPSSPFLSTYHYPDERAAHTHGHPCTVNLNDSSAQRTQPAFPHSPERACTTRSSESEKIPFLQKPWNLDRSFWSAAR